LTRLIRHVRSNAVAYLALMVALGGTSYAAMSLPANSVGGRQIRNHVIDPVKLNPRYIASSVRAWASVSAKGRIIASSAPAQIVATVGSDQITWRTTLFRNCTAVASVANPLGPGALSTPAFADASIVPVGPRRVGAVVTTYMISGGDPEPSRQPYAVMVLCPTPPP
jgi:hypothetical protein